jgi:transcriptional regulator with PAS, ATPase and Fis domain
VWIYLAQSESAQGTRLLLACESEEPNNSLRLQSLYYLAELISHIYLKNRTVEKVFLKSEYQQAICEAVTHGYLTVDRFGVVTYLNPNGAKYLHISEQDVIGKMMSDVPIFKDQKQLLDVVKTGEQWYHREFLITTTNGPVHFIFSALPIRDDRKHMVGVIYIFEKLKDFQKKYGNLMGSQPYFHFDNILFRSQSMAEIVHLAKAAARTEANILIEGESGTGKELIAQAIHNFSPRAKGPFVVIDCSAIPRDLVESELFGYVDGAFTGARKGGRLGKFEMSNGGTVFLDEIGEMPLEMQAKLLRVIQNRTITRVGGHETIPVDFRIIAATNRNLEEEVRLGQFRLDLYYRLNVIHLMMPPLRERPEDVEYLVPYFIRKAASRLEKPVPELSKEVLDICLAYSWPGNIRELENVMERAVFLCEGRVEPRHLPKNLLELSCHGARCRLERSLTSISVQPLQDAEFYLIQNALQESNGNKKLAAQKLGISRSTLYEKMKRYALS